MARRRHDRAGQLGHARLQRPAAAQRETAETNARADKLIAVLSPATGEITPLTVRGTHARWVPSGHLLYIRNDVLVTRPFDLDTL